MATVDVKRARIQAVIFASLVVVAMLSIVYGIYQSEKVERLENKVQFLQHQLDSVNNSIHSKE